MQVGVTTSLPAAVLEPWADLVVARLEDLNLASLRPRPEN